MNNQVESETWKVESGKSRLQAQGLKGFSFHFELSTFHLRLSPLHKRRFNVQNGSTSKSGNIQFWEHSRGARMNTVLNSSVNKSQPLDLP